MLGWTLKLKAQIWLPSNEYGFHLVDNPIYIVGPGLHLAASSLVPDQLSFGGDGACELQGSFT